MTIAVMVTILAMITVEAMVNVVAMVTKFAVTKAEGNGHLVPLYYDRSINSIKHSDQTRLP